MIRILVVSCLLFSFLPSTMSSDPITFRKDMRDAYTSLDVEARNKLDLIVNNEAMGYDEVIKALKEQRSNVNALKESLDKILHKEDLEKEINDLIGTLPENSREVGRKLVDLAQRTDRTTKQIYAEIHEIIAQSSPEVREELDYSTFTEDVLQRFVH